MTAVLLLLVKVAVGVLILAIGMGATVANLTYVWRRPGLLLRSFLEDLRHGVLRSLITGSGQNCPKTPLLS